MSLYDALLVDQNATLEEIKLAFKQRALQVHPDKGGSKEEFHLVYQALETLADPEARQKYDHSLATTKTGPAPHAPHPKSRKRKREEKHAQQATSCKAETKTKPPVPGKNSTTFAGNAPSKPPRATATAMPAEPQSKQTKLLMKIRDFLKRLPRAARNDVITNQLSQKQRVILEKFMVDNANTSSTQGDSEAKALAPAAGKSVPHQPAFETETSPRETPRSPRRTEDSSHGSCLVALPATIPYRRFAHSMDKIRHPKKRARSSLSLDAICNEPGHSATSSTMQASPAQSLTSETTETCARTKAKNAPMNEMPGEGCYSLAVPTSKRGYRPDVRMTRAKPSGKMKIKDKNIKKTFTVKAENSGCVYKAGSVYVASIKFDYIVLRTRNACHDLQTALEDLMILTSVKQKVRNHTGAGTLVECLQAAIVSSVAEHGRNLADFKLSFMVFQSAGCFIGSNLISPSVHSLEVFGKMRSVLEPFRQYAKNLGSQNVYWQFSPVHLEDAWERFQSAVARAWELAGRDSTSTLRRIRAHHEAQAPFRSANLQWWERRQMARQDKNKHRPKRLRERNPLGKLIARWGNMLKRESKLLDQQRQRVLRQRKHDQEERRRLEVLKQKRQREEERSRREWVRKRMRTDLTMDDILGQNSVRNYPNLCAH